MNGPEHYTEAERLLEDAANPRRYITGIDGDHWTAAQLEDLAQATGASHVIADGVVQIHDQTLAAAQVHATLALVAATIDAAEVDSYADGGLQHVASPSEIRNWREVTS